LTSRETMADEIEVASMRSCEAFIFIGDSGIGIFLGASRSEIRFHSLPSSS
jgi:hypothetical protein